MEECIDTISYKGYEVKIYPDCDPESPREWDNLGTMVCFHGRYSLGDKQYDYRIEELEETIERKDVISLPLYLYDHSGITMRTTPFSCQWDSGQVGHIFVTYEDIKRELGVKNITKRVKERVIKALEGEVLIYNDYLVGNVYGYRIEDSKGDIIDSCWGFYGDEYEIDECKNIIDYEIRDRRKKRAEKLKTLIRHGVPLDKRMAII